jgi:hypothetical protein
MLRRGAAGKAAASDSGFAFSDGLANRIIPTWATNGLIGPHT